MLKYMSDASKKEAKSWAIEKPKLDNARELRGIFFNEPNDEEFKLTVNAARGKLEVPMPAAILTLVARLLWHALPRLVWWPSHLAKRSHDCWACCSWTSSSCSSVRRLLAPCAHPTRQPSRPRTMPFSAPLQDRTTLSLLTFLELAVCGLGPDPLYQLGGSPSGCSKLIHTSQRSWKKSVRHAGTIALLTLLFLLLGNMGFFFHPRPSTQRMHLILFVGWTAMTHLMKFRKTKKQKVATGSLLDKLHRQDFAGPLSSRASRVLGPISRHRVADILPYMKSVSRTSRPGSLSSHPL